MTPGEATRGLSARAGQPTDLPHVAADGLRFELAAEAAGIGTFEWDLTTNELSWDTRLRALLGFDAEEPASVGRFVSRILPADQPAVERAAREAIRAGGQLRIDFRIIDDTGGTHWLTTRGQVVRDDAGREQRMLGAVFDTSSLRDDREQVARALDTMATAYATVDPDWTVRYANQAARALLSGREPVGNSVWQLMPSLADADVADLLRAVMDGGEPVTVELHARRSGRWLELSVQAISDGIAVLINDITERRQAQDEAASAHRTAELATGRLEFLASVADALGSTLEADTAAQRLARMLVPALADWSMVTLLDDEGHVEDIASSHCDPGQQPLLDRYVSCRRAALLADSAMIDEVIDVGQPLFQMEQAAFLARLKGEGSDEVLAQLAPGAVTALPILARDRALGVISLYNGVERGLPSEAEVETAREVARRAGLVLDNARLYDRFRSRAETLQRSLLTPAVSPPDLQVVTRYVPAVADAQVGGDWYDAFHTGDGTTTLVIGDVMGHDTEAAALMGQLRTMVRAIAVDRREPPGAVLRRVDAAAETLGVDTTATAVLAQVLEGSATVGGRRLRWSNAGHPPPVLLEENGAVSFLDAPPDVLLGLGGHFQRADHTVELPPGSTVLLFSDGLVEGRSQPLEVGLRRLAIAARPLTGLPLDELCDQLLEALLPGQGAEDDVALVAVRVSPPGSTGLR